MGQTLKDKQNKLLIEQLPDAAKVHSKKKFKQIRKAAFRVRGTKPEKAVIKRGLYKTDRIPRKYIPSVEDKKHQNT